MFYLRPASLTLLYLLSITLICSHPIFAWSGHLTTPSGILIIFPSCTRDIATQIVPQRPCRGGPFSTAYLSADCAIAIGVFILAEAETRIQLFQSANFLVGDIGLHPVLPKEEVLCAVLVIRVWARGGWFMALWYVAIFHVNFVIFESICLVKLTTVDLLESIHRNTPVRNRYVRSVGALMHLWLINLPIWAEWCNLALLDRSRILIGPSGRKCLFKLTLLTIPVRLDALRDMHLCELGLGSAIAARCSLILNRQLQRNRQKSTRALRSSNGSEPSTDGESSTLIMHLPCRQILNVSETALTAMALHDLYTMTHLCTLIVR